MLKKKNLFQTYSYSSLYVKTMSENNRELNDENTSISEIYEKAYNHWDSVASDVDGMLGGFSQLHIPDINASKQFICLLQKSVCYKKEN